MLVREWGLTREPARHGTVIGAVFNRASDGALVVAWIMPKIVLVFRLAGTVNWVRRQNRLSAAAALPEEAAVYTALEQG
jgi:hypothetical protein